MRALHALPPQGCKKQIWHWSRSLPARQLRGAPHRGHLCCGFQLGLQLWCGIALLLTHLPVRRVEIPALKKATQQRRQPPGRNGALGGAGKAAQARTGCPWGSASSSAAFLRTWPAVVAPALPLRRPAAGCLGAPAAGCGGGICSSHTTAQTFYRAVKWIQRHVLNRTRGAWVSPLGSAIVANPFCAQLTTRGVQRPRSLRPRDVLSTRRLCVSQRFCP